MQKQLAYGDPIQAVQGYRARAFEKIKSTYAEYVANRLRTAVEGKAARRAACEEAIAKARDKQRLDYMALELAALSDSELKERASNPSPVTDPLDYAVLGAELGRRGMSEARDTLRLNITARGYHDPVLQDEEYLAFDKMEQAYKGVNPAKGLYLFADSNKPRAAMIADWDSIEELRVNPDTRSMELPE